MKFSAILASVALLAAATSAAPQNGAPKYRPGKWFDRVFYIIFENTDYDVAVVNPVFKALADRPDARLLTNFRAVTHPSLPNYLAMIGGSDFGIHDDAIYNITAKTIVDLMEKKGVSWKSYNEDYPKHKAGECYLAAWPVTDNGTEIPHSYVRKHTPFLSFTNIQHNKERCSRILHSDSFVSDYNHNRLPQYMYYVPQLMNDGHDTNVTFVGEYITKTFSHVFNDKKFLKRTLVVVTFDESDNDKSNDTNQIYTLIFGGAVNTKKHGKVDNTLYDHYSVLATIEKNWGLGNLGRNDTRATLLTI
ncbi:phosphoesterase family-domain-containing protein [Jimgerdemannia flammicorona]|uniref:Phosphoesterase family-domain-containing protein n=1 Tax=Jimgerdemannia flammicorona TaxID=994334 RepID=A0A433CVJ6_9FUNG|nr:phosphoesterase family-domain-containing protein [Jimgerdemannia flammicorona]